MKDTSLNATKKEKEALRQQEIIKRAARTIPHLSELEIVRNKKLNYFVPEIRECHIRTLTSQSRPEQINGSSSLFWLETKFAAYSVSNQNHATQRWIPNTMSHICLNICKSVGLLICFLKQTECFGCETKSLVLIEPCIAKKFDRTFQIFGQ